ncbi:MAG: hypothetical protein LC135_08775 [Phycisphaerae bacterium]|nr:hypothetical protein [Phycisphaerae bacterium]MCZ2399944.1 hypothetical protein [Phycisphaerae bacterium]
MPRAFEFRLETVLRVREQRQREAQRRLAARQAEMVRLERLDEQLAAQVGAAQSELRAVQAGERLDPALVARMRGWIGHLRRVGAENGRVRAGLAAELAQLQAEVSRARTQTRVLEKLRERRFRQYKRQRERVEQEAAEEQARGLHVQARASAGAPAGDGVGPGDWPALARGEQR